MMANLFSSFDPSALFNISFNWLSALMITMFLTPLYWVIPAKTSMTAISLKNKLHLEFNALLGNKHLTGETILLLALFIFVLTNNFLGLFPYIFTASSHMTLTLSLAMPLWLTFMLFGWINHTNHMFAHMVPNGTPGILMPFMVLIESVSNLIRPITLSVRLMANMTAGHLLMTLLGNQTAVASNAILMSLLLIQIMLLTLESAVAVIQSYVFATLSTLYASEVMTH